MNLAFPSREFDEAVAAVCHGAVSDEQARELNALLRANAEARDEYLVRLEIHSRLASEPDLYVWAESDPAPARPARTGGAPLNQPANVLPHRRAWNRRQAWAVALAAGFALLAAGWWGLRPWYPAGKKGTTSRAVAMLNRVVNPQWAEGVELPRLGAPLEPGWLRLETGLAQVVFYNGARVVLQGPAELELVSPNQATCRRGRLMADVPPPARGFRITTPQMAVTDLGATFGLEVTGRRTELQVFKGVVELQPAAGDAKQRVREDSGAVMEDARAVRLIAAHPTVFAALFEFQETSEAAIARRYHQWRSASALLNHDATLLVHLNFDEGGSPDWRLQNSGNLRTAGSDATIVGCQWTSGRWPDKQALEFQSGSDRVRLSVPGEFDQLTLAAWVRVQGLDRKLNSLFMSDGFEPGEVHWLIRDDGVLSLTVKGRGPGKSQILASPPVLTLDRFGAWLHLAVVLDGSSRRAVHYLNGLPVSEHPLGTPPPYRIGATELGNWNASGFPGDDPAMIRNFSGAMDEFCLFGRALDGDEIRALYADGRPQPDPAVHH